jgi:hypothetical protein
MKYALKTTSRFAVLGLLVAGLSGCGTRNPMGPDPSDMAQVPATAEAQTLTAPVAEDPSGDETGTWTAEPEAGVEKRGTKSKDKVAKTPRNGRSGWNMSP